jgi:hypothetical protein
MVGTTLNLLVQHGKTSTGLIAVHEAKRVREGNNNIIMKRGSVKRKIKKNYGRLMGWVVITYAPEKAKKTDKFSISIT